MNLHEEIRRQMKLMTISEEIQPVDDFFNFLERDPRMNTVAHVYYATFYNRGLAKPKQNPMVNRFIKYTDYSFRFGQTYARAVELKNPDYVMQQRKGEYDKVQGYNVLETDAKGELVLPIVPLGTRSVILLLNSDGGGGVERMSFDEMKAKYGEYFTPSAFNQYGSSSGETMRALKVNSIVRINAGGARWENPNFQMNAYKNLLNF